nr:T9SS type A sorting domain-containing protein [Bacteroidota bacterium]
MGTKINIAQKIADSYRGNQQIFIKGAGAGKVLVSDMMGRVVHQHHINGTDLISIHVNLKTGIYMVSVTDGNNLKTEKIFIR